MVDSHPNLGQKDLAIQLVLAPQKPGDNFKNRLGLLKFITNAHKKKFQSPGTSVHFAGRAAGGTDGHLS